MDYRTWTRYPTDVNTDYKYWGWYGPVTATGLDLLKTALVIFVLIPLAIVFITALLLTAIAVPPVGIMCIKAYCANG